MIDRSTIFGNPFYIGSDGNRTEVVEKYYRYLKHRLYATGFKRKLMRLKGKRLGCWCRPLLCHGDVIVDYLEKGGVWDFEGL